MTIILGQRGRKRERCVRIGLVNNMPDAALGRTERQFRNLFAHAAPGIAVEFRLLALAGIQRGEAGRHHLEINEYRRAEDVPRSSLDACIITGTEPRHADLEDEPYWDAMRLLFDRLERERLPAMFSCLAAHAAALHFDGLRRRPLPQKLFGVFEHFRACAHALTDDLAPVVPVAHSRGNEILPEVLERGGYRVLTLASDSGADLFVRKGIDNWLFCQGHPEYDPDALGREFQRDVRRFVVGERHTYPDMPLNYFARADAEALARFEKRARSARSASTMADYPVVSNSCLRTAAWTPPTASVFEVWIKTILRDRLANGEEAPAWTDAGQVASADVSARRRALSQPVPIEV